MKAEIFKSDKHYKYLVETWDHYKWLPCPLEFLPKIGVIVCEKDRFIAALFMYLQSGSMAYVTWAVGSHKATKEERDKAFAILFVVMKKVAIKHKCKFMYGATTISAFKNRMKSWGFTPVETGMDSFVLPLDYNGSVDFLKD